MRIRHLLASLALLASAVAHGVPVSFLPLSCPDEDAINQVALDACSGYVYELPTNELIVVSPSGSSYFWRKASDLAGHEAVLVCTIPVEPGTYSSCRDATGRRRTAYQRKDVHFKEGRNSVVVSKTGGHYSDPVTAANNAFAGDIWCIEPQWPDQPCVMAIGDGIFILSETLHIPEGLAVSGNGKGNTMLVADNGIETAVSSFGNVRISNVTIVNSQPGGARTTGLEIDKSATFGVLVQLHAAAIHVSGAAQNVAVLRSESIEILDSEITAVGQGTTGMSNLNPGPPDVSTRATVERSLVSAEVAFHEEYGGPAGASLRLLDSRIFGNVSFDPEHSLLVILRSGIVGNVTAKNDAAGVVIGDSSIKGNVDIGNSMTFSAEVSITNTSVEGRLLAGWRRLTFDGLTVHGEFVLEGVGPTEPVRILRSYIINSATTAPALHLRAADVQLEQTFVQGTPALLAADMGPPANRASQLDTSSSVFVGAVSGSAGSVLSCTNTYGADYELLNAACQPQTP
jgi:hypothetical protein